MKKFPYLSNDVLKKSIQIKSNLIDIIFSQDELSNKSFTTLFLCVVNLIFEIKQNEIKNELLLSNDNLTIMNKEKIQVFELLDLFISWLPSQVSKNWTKMSAFLEVIYIHNKVLPRFKSIRKFTNSISNVKRNYL